MITPLVLRRYRLVDGWRPGAVKVHDERSTGWAIEVDPIELERREPDDAQDPGRAEPA